MLFYFIFFIFIYLFIYLFIHSLILCVCVMCSGGECLAFKNSLLFNCIGLDKSEYQLNIFTYFSTKTCVVGTH